MSEWGRRVAIVGGRLTPSRTLEPARQILVRGGGRHAATVEPIEPQYRRVDVVL